MRVFILKVCFFIVLLAAVISSVGSFDNLDKSYTQNHNINKAQNLNKFDDLDILFVGNSYVYSGVKNSLFDSLSIKTFNLGIATSGPYYYDMLINEYLGVIKTKPRQIFMMLSPIIFSNEADNFLIYPIHRYLSHPRSNTDVVFDYGVYDLWVPMQQKSFEKGVKNCRRIIKGTVPPDYANKSLFLDKGYVESEKIISEQVISQTEKLYLPFGEYDFDEDRLARLIKLTSDLQANGIQVVFFELPTNRLTTYFNEKFLNQYESVVRKIEKKHVFIPNQLTLNDSCYKDLDHLNKWGAEVATKNLIKNIKKLRTQ